MPEPDQSTPDFAHRVNLASARLGAQAISATDEFFAPAARMLQDAAAVFVPGKYDDHGKWMDGWESRRKRGPGHDTCVVKLGLKGVISGVDIDTSHFTGNFPPAASMEACNSDAVPGHEAVWTEILPQTPLGPSAHHYRPIHASEPATHVMLHIYPDGGVARLRVYGEPVPDWNTGDRGAVHELSALRNGGRIVGYNDAHYGSVWTMLTAGRGLDMGDGWETRRRREPGNDWIIVRLGAPGYIERIEVDTCHYKGNFPAGCSVEAGLLSGSARGGVITQSMFWPRILEPQPLSPDAIHEYGPALINSKGPVSHVKLSIYPDGGISRFRVFGRLA